MKKIYFYAVFFILCFASSVFGQMPQSMSYQAIVRNSSDQLMPLQQIGLQVSIIKDSINGLPVYVETHQPTTNINGLFTVEIGTGNTSNNFSLIPWQSGLFFLKTEIDLTGGTSYTLTSNNQLLSVPFAFHAKTADSVLYGISETDPIFNAWDKSSGIQIMESQVIDLKNYLLVEADTIFAANFDFTNVVVGDLLHFDGVKWVRFTPNFLTTYNETDPIFSAWDKSSGILISESQITNLQNYLTTELDPKFDTHFDFSNLPAVGDLLRFDGFKWSKFTPNYLTNFTENDPIFSAWDKSSGILITESQITDLQSYLTAETDPAVVANFDFTNALTGDLLKFNGTKWEKFTPNYLSSFTESDPIFSAWDKSSGILITESQITNLQNYLTVEADPAVFANFDFTNASTGDLLKFNGTKWEKFTPNYLTVETQNLTQVLAQGNAAFAQIKNLQDPTDPQDAVTKSIVDELKDQILELEIATGLKAKDSDGNIYQTVAIGSQRWMAENLRTTTYNDSTPILHLTSHADWQNTNAGAYSWYDNNVANKTPYGALYNWHAVETGKLCPYGWHVPTHNDFTILSNFLGGEALAGGKLKKTGFTHWVSPNTGATNSTGFSAVAGGSRDYDGVFYGLNYYGFWWSSTEETSGEAWYRNMAYNATDFFSGHYITSLGFSVVCVKD